VTCTRSATFVLRFLTWKLAISLQASYAVLRTLHGLGCPPHALAPLRFTRSVRATAGFSARPVFQRSTPRFGFQTLEFRSDLFSTVCNPSRNASNYTKTTALESSASWQKLPSGTAVRRHHNGGEDGFEDICMFHKSLPVLMLARSLPNAHSCPAQCGGDDQKLLTSKSAQL